MEERLEDQLPEVNYAQGYLYLYRLLSHLTSSMPLFIHKINVIMQLSRDISKSQFTRSEVEAMFPHYPTKVLDSIMNSLIDGGWFIREEGRLTYQFSNVGILFTRFLPFLYRGDQLDSMAFQGAIQQILDAAERMKLDIFALEFLRDQAIHAVQRDIAEIESALISRNEERIYATSQRVETFINNLGQLIGRFKEFNRIKRKLKGAYEESDRQAIHILQQLEYKILQLFEKRKTSMKASAGIGEYYFTKGDIDRFLYTKDFTFLANLTDALLYLPSNVTWVDEDDILISLNVFLGRKKLQRKRRVSNRVYGLREEIDTGIKTYVEQVEEVLQENFNQEEELDLATILKPFLNKVDSLMLLATICFLADKPIDRNYRLLLDATHQYEQLVDHPFKGLTKTIIKRRKL